MWCYIIPYQLQEMTFFMIYVARHRNSPVNRCMNMYVQGCVHILHMRLMSHYQLRSESWNVVLGTAFHLFHTLKSKDFCVMAFFFFWTSLDIKLADTYRNRVEGLCGDFDGRHRNDFTSPNGVWVKNVNVFGESWKVPLKRTTSRLRYLIFYLISMASTATGSEWIKP